MDFDTLRAWLVHPIAIISVLDEASNQLTRVSLMADARLEEEIDSVKSYANGLA